MLSIFYLGSNLEFRQKHSATWIVIDCEASYLHILLMAAKLLYRSIRDEHILDNQMVEVLTIKNEVEGLSCFRWLSIRRVLANQSLPKNPTGGEDLGVLKQNKRLRTSNLSIPTLIKRELPNSYR